MAADKSEFEVGEGGDMDFMEFEEEDLATSRLSSITQRLFGNSSSIADTKFDITIGHIEDIIMEEEFQSLQQNFQEKYYAEFDDSDENKFIYTDIHKEYIDLIERYIESQLQARMEEFDMAEFTRQLESRREELDGEVFEMLLTFSDFLAFKEMFLDFKAEKEGRTVDFSSGFTVTSLGPHLGVGDGLQMGISPAGSD